MSSSPPIVPEVAGRIFVVRGRRAILDADLAALYGVATKRLNEQVRRNRDRFPEDFAFAITHQELTDLKSQIATSSSGHGGRRKAVTAFTEHGAIMAATILNSKRAIHVSVYVVRTFVALRNASVAHQDLANKIAELEARVRGKFAVHDRAIEEILEAIKTLMSPAGKEHRPIGFVQTPE